MTCAPLGELAAGDPLHRFLAEQVLGEVLACPVASPRFDVFALGSSGAVYRYHERGSGVDLVGKFYGRKCAASPPEVRTVLLAREHENLCALRALGLDRPPWEVARPLAASPAHDWVLVEAYVPGPDLLHHVEEAAAGRGDGRLEARLEVVAAFLSGLHRRTATGGRVDGWQALVDLDTAVREVAALGLLDDGAVRRFRALLERWIVAGALRGPAEARVHGDATPAHFRGLDGGGATAIDLELLRPGDPAQDLGTLAAELLHFFWRAGGGPGAADAHIARLYAAYRAAGGTAAVAHDDGRARFYLACHLLRICRNGWLDEGFRRLLIEHAEACLTI